ncbi:hypothetical protein [Nocardia cyriacigeorgica]|uniref:hypothetical protein n=1 Tax=Nocardia cyriacigeorgica TaxID=135487 RepID=UPI001894B451|nr:hypothetical protein [Nocardia cyriacigeorgica]MBF6435736.1 hypothetical protein [Nocardia cyriacigeorgica]
MSTSLQRRIPGRSGVPSPKQPLNCPIITDTRTLTRFADALRNWQPDAENRSRGQ